MRALAALLLAACSVERTAMLVAVDAQSPPPQILATGISLLWHDASHVGWSVWVAWQEADGGPCHTDYWPCRAPWGGPFSIDQCVVQTTADIVDGYCRRWGIPRASRLPPPWTGHRAWWWLGDPAIEPLLLIAALGPPQAL